MKLKKKNLLTTSDGIYIEIYTQKTGSFVRVPLPEYISPIVARYSRKAGAYILPRLSGSNMNLQIKKIIELKGWVNPIPKYRHRQGKLIELKNPKGNSFRFCDHITAHTMRRTAITSLLILGVPEIVVRKISGHAAGSAEFYRYVSIADEFLNHEVKKAFSYFASERNVLTIKTEKSTF